MSKTKLNIFLGKEGMHIEDMLRELDPAPQRTELENGIFFYKQVDEKKPRWIEDFFNDVIDNPQLRNKTIQAVYLTEIEVAPGNNRTFAITFGFGRNLLKLENFEERFGIITTMNLIDQDKLRAIDYNSPMGNPKTRRVQLGKTSSINDFELDREKDLVKNMAGRLIDESFEDAKTVSGKQSLSIPFTCNIDNIHESLIVLYHIFSSEVYKEKFPGIDYTREVKDKNILQQLDNQLLRLLNEYPDNQDGEVLIAMPEILPDQNVNGFYYSRSSNIYNDIILSDVINVIREIFHNEISIETLKRETIAVIGDNGIRHSHWKIYNCLITDLTFNGHQYVLNDGKWYEYEDNYAAEVNRYYNSALICDIPMPDCILYPNAEKEGAYNIRAAQAREGAVKWDCELINPFDETPFELCDIFDRQTNSFIHVKKDTGSAALSHLFLQGSVSGELVRIDTVRKQILENKPEMNESINEHTFTASSYTIVYGIIEKDNADSDRPKIPFFSRVSFRQIATTLTLCGYTVKLKSIKWR